MQNMLPEHCTCGAPHHLFIFELCVRRHFNELNVEDDQ